jgi:hypothetical protein
MKLTKQNIQFIDNYLKSKGISYLDIRLEMIDHIACEMETKISSHDFESLFQQTIYELGWAGDLKNYEQRRLRAINKTISKKYFKNIRVFFTDFKSLTVIVLFIMTYYIVFQSFSGKAFRMVSLLLFVTPIIYFSIHYAYISIKNKKSGYMLYGYFYLTFFMLMTNLLYQLGPDSIFPVTTTARGYIIFYTTIFNVICLGSGVKVYLETYRSYNKVYSRLTSD